MSNPLEAVPNMRKDHEFNLWQPLWRHSSNDLRCYIVEAFVRHITGWHVICHLEGDYTGPEYHFHVTEMTDHPPSHCQLHPDKPGMIYWTDTGRPLKAVSGGLL